MNDPLRTDFNTAYKSLRNRFRAYRPESIVRVAMDFLHRSSPDSMHELLKMPWHVLLLVKWVCQDTMTSDRKGRNITHGEFKKLRQQLHDFPEITDLGTRNTLSHMLFVRQLMRAQFDFQRPVPHFLPSNPKTAYFGDSLSKKQVSEYKTLWISPLQRMPQCSTMTLGWTRLGSIHFALGTLRQW